MVLCISLRSGRGRGRQGLDAAPEEMYQRSRGAPAPEETKMGFDIRGAPAPDEPEETTNGVKFLYQWSFPNCASLTLNWGRYQI